MSQDEVKNLFAQFGNIKSLVLKSHEKITDGQFGFVCYDDEKGNKEYGPECAQKAIEGLNGKDMGNGLKLYVKHAMKKTERAIEKAKETLKYKQSKKRCNLYVKNFPASWTEEHLKDIFSKFGAIERIKLEKGKASNVYAFVCFQTPDAAVNAKTQLHNQTFDGKALIITHYEIKEFRQIHIEEAIDKQDFEKYNAQKVGGFHLNDLTSHPHMIQIIQQLIEIVQQNEAVNARFNQSERRMGGGPMNRRGNFPGGRPNQQMPNMGMPGQMGMGGMGMPQPQVNQMMKPKAPVPQPMPGQQMQPPQMREMAPQPMPGMQVQNQAQMNPIQRYQAATMKILPSVTERNPYMKEQVGSCIFEFIQMLVQPDRVPKITGMLIELPVDQIKQYLSSFENLQAKVNEANDLINKASEQ